MTVIIDEYESNPAPAAAAPPPAPPLAAPPAPPAQETERVVERQRERMARLRAH